MHIGGTGRTSCWKYRFAIRLAMNIKVCSFSISTGIIQYVDSSISSIYVEHGDYVWYWKMVDTGEPCSAVYSKPDFAMEMPITTTIMSIHVSYMSLIMQF